LLAGQKAGDFESLGKLVDTMAAKNTADAIKTPGGNPPTSLNWDGHLDLEALKLRMTVPKDRFVEVAGDTECRIYADDNGAIVVMAGEALGLHDEISITQSNLDDIKEMFENISKTGLTEEIELENRMYMGERFSPYGHIDGIYKYRAQINGISYIEQDYLDIWTDDITTYVATIFLYYPNKNAEEYWDIFDKSLENLADM
jgi:hypothetical protein